MGTETTADLVAQWAQEMGLPVHNFPEFHESINDPVMKGAWTHIVQHVRPKQEVQQINRLIANYEYQKSNPGHGPIEVSLHKPEDVILHKKREKLKQILEQKRKEEALLDEEIKLAQKQLEEKRNTELALKRTIKNKQHKTSALKLKLQETKQVMSQATESNEKINALLTNAETNDSDKALILIKKSIKELMNLNQEKYELSLDFWCAMKQELLSQSPQVVIQGALSFCQDLCASIDALLYNRCEQQVDVDFSPVEAELDSMRSELSQTEAEYKKAESIRQERDDKAKALLEEITQLLMKDELNQDIGKIKADRIRESIEHESLLSQLEYVHKYLQDIETNNDAGEDEGSTVHNLSSDQKTEVKNTIQMMESCAKNIRDHVAQFQNLNQLFGKLKSSQDESLKLFEADIDKLSSLKVHEFRNKLVQVHSWLVQISDEYYANKIDNFQKETGSANFKQIQRLLSTLNALNEIQPLPDVRVNSSNKKPISPCRLPDSLSDEVMDNMNAKLQKVMSMYESLMSTQK